MTKHPDRRFCIVQAISMLKAQYQTKAIPTADVIRVAKELEKFLES